MDEGGEKSGNADTDGVGQGRGIYFFHDSTARLPVRDVTNRTKKEPYIEYGYERGLNDECIIGAENHCYPCYPKAIKKIVENDEEYLFLTTNPKHSEIPYNENLIVGYIRHQDHQPRGEDRYSVTGEVKLYSFDHAIPASEFGKRVKGPLGKWGETYTNNQTRKILNHFEEHPDVTNSCLEKVLELKEIGLQSDDGCGC